MLAKLDWIHEVENEPVITTGVDSLADLDEAINLEQDPNELCDRLICGMAHKGLSTETSPKIGIVTPCMEPGHTPVLPELGKPGKGYFIIPGTKLSSGPWEQIKADPGSALKSDKGCGYAECSSNWWDSVESYADKYPTQIRCEQRETLHSVQWADPDSDGCREHPAPMWAHPNNTVRMVLYLEKQVM